MYESLKSRPATPDDAEMLAQLAAIVFRFAYQSAFESTRQMEQVICEHLSPIAFRTKISDDQTWCHLGLVDDEPSGFIQIVQSQSPDCLSDATAPELSKLYVLPRFHGSGIASELLNRGIEHAVDSGASQIWLSVWEKNERAQAFYRRHGFSTIGEISILWGGTSFRDCVMTRPTSANRLD